MTADERFAAALGGEPFEMSHRDGRWLALSAERVAFAVDDFAGWRRLQQEGWLLSKWRAAGVPVARVLADDPARRIQIRERLHGLTGDEIHRETSLSPLFAESLVANPDVRARLRDAPLSVFGRRLAESYGELAARIRRAVETGDAHAAALMPTTRRALDLDAAIAALGASGATATAKQAAHRVRDWLRELPAIDAVIHSDLHFHNMCVSPAGDIVGVFDLGDAGLDNAETEFLYVHSLGNQFASAAMAAYGRPVDERRVIHAHLRTALDHVLTHGPGTERHDGVVDWASAVFELLA